jgi:lipopolysaccharide/colanic/teichoic acid biosynthesis glycosyltransferase
VRPGLSGIGSIVFRYEEEMMQGHPDPNVFYDHVIMPYKGKIEEWYVENQNLWTYFMLIGLTIWVILFPHSKKVWRVLDNLPKPGQELISLLQR